MVQTLPLISSHRAPRMSAARLTLATACDACLSGDILLLCAAGISAARLTGELAVIVRGPVLPPAWADCLIPSCAISDRVAARAASLPCEFRFCRFFYPL